MAILVLILSAHGENFNFVCHAILLYYKIFLITLTKLLFDESANPFPCG